MKTFMDAVQDIRKNLLPPNVNLFWHDGETEHEIKRLLDDVETLVKDKAELISERQEKLIKLHDLLAGLYSDFRHHRPTKEMHAEELDQYLVAVADWFSERYRIINSAPWLKTMYKKLGCDLFLDKRADVENPEQIELKGPAVIMMSHHLNIEPMLIQTMTPEHIYGVADQRLWWKKGGIRWFDMPGLRTILKKGGAIEVNLDRPGETLLHAVRECIHVLERNGMVMIASSVAINEQGEWDTKRSKAGAVFILEKAEKQLKQKIPIIPIGVKQEKNRYLVRVGKIMHIPDRTFDRNQFAESINGYIEQLAS